MPSRKAIDNSIRVLADFLATGTRGAREWFSVPATVVVPANGSTTLTVTVNGGLTPHSVVQGWINLDGPGSNDLHFAYYANVGR